MSKMDAGTDGSPVDRSEGVKPVAQATTRHPKTRGTPDLRSKVAVGGLPKHQFTGVSSAGQSTAAVKARDQAYDVIWWKLPLRTLLVRNGGGRVKLGGGPLFESRTPDLLSFFGDYGHTTD
jgi:hypothetical protein